MQWSFDATSIPPVQDRNKHFPDALKQRQIWCVSRSGTKVPLTPTTLVNADSTNPETWGTYADALSAQFQEPTLVLGLMCDGTFTVLDFDRKNITDPEQLEFLKRTHKIFQSRFAGHWISTSVSGEGEHVILANVLPPDHACRLQTEGIEIYGGRVGRYILETMNGSGDFFAAGEDTFNTYIQFMKNAERRLPSDTCTRSVNAIIEHARQSNNWNERHEYLLKVGYPAGCDKSIEDARLMEMICFHTKEHGSEGNADLAIEAFKFAACWSPERQAEKSRKRSGKLEQYLEITASTAFGKIAVNEGRRKHQIAEMAKDFAPELFQSVQPNIVPATAATIQEEQTTGDPLIDEKFRSVRNRVSAGTFLYNYVDFFNKRTQFTTYRTQHMFSLFSGIGVLGSAAARTFFAENLMPTVGVIGVGGTGVGKDEIIQTPKMLLQEAGLSDSIGSGSPASGAAICTDLSTKHPIQIYMIDELGAWFAKVRSQHTTDVTSILRQVIGRSHVLFKSTSYADPKKKLDDIEYPAVGILGATTEEQLMDVFLHGMVKDGFIQRLMFALSVAPEIDPPDVAFQDIEKTPADLVDFLAVTGNAQNDGDKWTKPDTDGPPILSRMTFRKDVLKLAREMKLVDNEAERKRRGQPHYNVKDKLLTRRIETGKRIGMISALSCGRHEIDLVDFQWGLDVAELSILNFVKLSTEAIHNGELRDVRYNIIQLMRKLYEEGKGYTFTDREGIYVQHSHIIRKTGNKANHEYMRRARVEPLFERHEAPSGNNKPVTYYRIPDE